MCVTGCNMCVTGFYRGVKGCNGGQGGNRV